MNFLVVSECFLFRNSLTHLFENIFDDMNVKSLPNLKDISIEDIMNSELLFLDSNSQQNYITKAVKDIKKFKDIKIIILDTKKDKSLFLDLLKVGIDGYILDISDEDDFKYIIKKIINGKKFFDSDLLGNFKNECVSNFEDLTKKEEQVMKFLIKGLSNKNIAKEVDVTEYTIKKHVSSILSKLNLKNRQDIIIYAIERGKM
ncbi:MULTISPECIES: response regulator transcription factor [Paraclostridium]|uniref:DNA-binding response regulator n=4 Tax=Paraclostridium bifermentans TaxID=1490 RepID=A0A5P3XIK7_PARBF|nr:response regulator transcription factor [Paraclostridium bifermentans]MDV8108860.1 response regulator transcription factor [Bacillus sp. BAU-SS-2023]MCE9675800.1 response regulator transcription factor [Paraclostridium bifermentans]MCR1875476.1 response regulator transcription factor [Paraclostridium bifermentans]QEZ70191.1 DNA-binding response regulator [Paraclostridium bifermentans]UOW67159.1 response regulator transcription factor [Paraclostridium bifermentans]